MIVRLTVRQWDAIRGRLPAWLSTFIYEEGQIKDEDSKVEVLLLPDAWRAIADELIDSYFTTGSIRKVNKPLFDGVRRIVKQTNARTEHPAFAGVALEGRQFEVLPAWEWLPDAEGGLQPLDPRTHWSPWIPSRDEIRHRSLCSLWPEHHRKQGVVFTTWHHSTMRSTGPISVDAYDRFIKARSAA